MKKLISLTILLVVLGYGLAFSQDKPDGFASVSGLGLTTTTGGAGGKTVTVTTFSDLQKYASASEPLIILIKGKIDADSKGALVSVSSNKTIVGLGNDATLYQGELNLMRVKNVIIRNLIIRDSYVEGDPEGKSNDWDAIQADSCHHIWIDHCFLTHNCDGLIDLRKACDYVTVSWVRFYNHNKAFGIGWTKQTDFRTTIHHCWFDSTNQRNPSFDMGIGHLYNNYVRKVISYGNLARGEARVVVENSYYEDCKAPLQINDNAKLFVSNIKNINGDGGQTAGNVTTMPFNPKDSYNYTLDPVDNVKDIVSSGAGPKAAIGEQYTKTNIDLGQKVKPEAPLYSLSINGKNILHIRSLLAQSYSVVLMKANGCTVGKFNGNGSSILRCKLPNQGLFFVSITQDNAKEDAKHYFRIVN